MSRQITALYDTRADAEAAKSRLTAANIDADNVRIVDNASASDAGLSSGSGSSSSSMSGSSSSMTGSSNTESSHGGGFLGSLKNMFVPDEDRHSYNEGIRRGGSLLYADVDEDDVDQAITILEQTSSVDMDERENSWRSEGWAGYSPSTSTDRDTSASRDYAATTDTNRTTGNEEHIQLAEEQLVVGKREVNRGGARIRSYVVERPVTEQVSLREEHVNIERRPVSGSTATAGTMDNNALFQERTIEMTETAEEAVVGKQARVTEELVVSKTAEERVETIHDTVRKTEVEIDEDASTTNRTGSTGMGGSSTSGGSTDRDRY